MSFCARGAADRVPIGHADRNLALTTQVYGHDAHGPLGESCPGRAGGEPLLAPIPGEASPQFDESAQACGEGRFDRSFRDLLAERGRIESVRVSSAFGTGCRGSARGRRGSDCGKRAGLIHPARCGRRHPVPLRSAGVTRQHRRNLTPWSTLLRVKEPRDTSSRAAVPAIKTCPVFHLHVSKVQDADSPGERSSLDAPEAGVEKQPSDAVGFGESLH